MMLLGAEMLQVCTLRCFNTRQPSDVMNSVNAASRLRCLVSARDGDADDVVAASDIDILVLLGRRGSQPVVGRHG